MGRRALHSGGYRDRVTGTPQPAAGGERGAVLAVSDEDAHRELRLTRADRERGSSAQPAADLVEDEDRNPDTVRKAVLHQRRGGPERSPSHSRLAEGDASARPASAAANPRSSHSCFSYSAERKTEAASMPHSPTRTPLPISSRSVRPVRANARTARHPSPSEAPTSARKHPKPIGPSSASSSRYVLWTTCVSSRTRSIAGKLVVRLAYERSTCSKFPMPTPRTG